ncbi:hypothetical protein LEMA_P004650.1 [Plenodomus lingam JN3]|uniref:Uncharacterized protein n=1 Tax=Leptosphaeria maculans (strain JN3 / isolate v23.1.3 / race Av1-4-5-6-7-8) TaxID=985895 RepID=E5AEN9_LEPMJ|nr:hypothetical protein LEMA_P004650.1 [Plenodomus lingam JN3]CBY01678.1 hypothetical protein LEMA_P004650.1 [Plenodomus lingam JN3]
MNGLIRFILHLTPYLYATSIFNVSSGLPSDKLAAAFDNTRLTNSYDPSATYQGTAIVEVWIGEEPVNVGDVWGSALYHTVESALRSICNDNDNGQCSASKGVQYASFGTAYLAGRNQVKSSERTQTLASLTVEGASYKDALTRNILIAIIARTLQATVQNEGQNCYWENNIRFCNVGSLIRVNMHENGVKNYLHVRLHSEQAAKGGFACCDTLGSVDSGVNMFGARVESVYGRYSRDVRCITEGFKMCAGRVAGDG